eukprot:TRINITY_DN105589_c0_g1_i1.p1 TRINITY_DN105589_c0_g1~~TRINITY_DN105589_c0_g1_i1.p1  ORF type:complete len:489 (+),score=96.85 TRINITY_DN105589_c0_g1_i1:125-1591(+)
MTLAASPAWSEDVPPKSKSSKSLASENFGSEAGLLAKKRGLSTVADPGETKWLESPDDPAEDQQDDDEEAYVDDEVAIDTTLPAHGWRQKLQRIVRSEYFVLSVAFVIIANAVFMGVEVDAEKGPDTSAWDAIEIIFSLIFLLELVLRLVATTPILAFFMDGWNLLDMVIVTISIVDNLIVLAVKGGAGDLNKLTTLRLLRLARVVRVFRLLRVVDGLWRLVRSILNAVWTLVWTWVLLGLVIYIFSIMATRLIGQSNKGRGNPSIQEYFGTVGRSMLTLFQITTTERWADIARLVVNQEPWFRLFFILYLHVTTFSLLNVMMAVIVENIVDDVGGPKAKLSRKRLNEQKVAYKNIYKAFKDLDLDGDGLLTLEEFEEQITKPELQKNLEQLGINHREAENLFGILDYDGSGSLDAQEFVRGLMKAVGVAKSKDVLALHCEMRRSETQALREIRTLREKTNNQITILESGVKSLRQEVQDLTAAIGRM